MLLTILPARSIAALDSFAKRKSKRFGIVKLNINEEQFARTFIVPEKRAHYLSLLESKCGRDKLPDGFYHCRDLDSRFAMLIPAN